MRPLCLTPQGSPLPAARGQRDLPRTLRPGWSAFAPPARPHAWSRAPHVCLATPGTWEKARPTRTTDRKCEKWTACELKKTYETVKGTTYSDRTCGKVTECDAKKGDVELTAPTLTSDRTCGKVLGQSANSAVSSCLVLLQRKTDTKNGWYWIQPNSKQQARRTYVNVLELQVGLRALAIKLIACACRRHADVRHSI